MKVIDSKSPTPIAQQLRSILLTQIKEGHYRPGQRFPSERALAEQYRISRTSVREAITQLLSEGVLFRTVGRGTFVSENAASKLRAPAGPSRQIGLWISADVFNFVQPGYSQILTGAGEVCRDRGYRAQLHLVDAGRQALDSLFEQDSPDGGMDGNLVVGGVNRHVLDRLRELGAPLLLVDLLVPDELKDSVRIDYASGIRQAVEHLKALGHEEIGFIGFPGSQKYEAFWESLEACGLPYHPRYVGFLSVSDLVPGMLAGYRSMQRMMNLGRLPTAVLVTNDSVALGVLQALEIAGLRVPDDISVVGCDDLCLSSHQLTTIRVDLIEVGRIAARALVDRIERGIEAQAQILVPVRLVVRSTTAPPRAKSTATGATSPSGPPPVEVGAG